MDVIVLFNGLGNQMSQYAFYLKKKTINPSTYFFSHAKDHNGLELEKVFGIDCNQNFRQKKLKFLFQLLLTVRLKAIMRPVKAALKYFNCVVIKEKFDYTYKPEYLLPSSGIAIYYGGWPSEKYFVDVKEKILQAFVFQPLTDAENINHVSVINQTNSISIHIRRGDYLNSDNINLFGKVCTLEYYKVAIELISSKVNNPHFFVFSNDLNWAKENFSADNFTFVTNNSGQNSWKDMYLMSICKHNIIANSSFSWWGAWLNKNSDRIIISPCRYLNSDTKTDFYPEAWIKLSEY